MADTATETPMAGGKKSAWMVHVKKTMRANKGMKLGKVLKLAAKSYKKTKRGGGGGVAETASPLSGGGVAATAATVGGRRRRGKSSRKTRKH